MTCNLLHLVAAYGAVEIGGERGLDSVTHVVPHRVTPWLRRDPFPDRDTDATGGLPDSCSVAASRMRSAARPRVRRDFTVPRLVWRISAISSYVNPSISRSTTTVRNASGTPRSAFSTRSRT